MRFCPDAVDGLGELVYELRTIPHNSKTFSASSAWSKSLRLHHRRSVLRGISQPNGMRLTNHWRWRSFLKPPLNGAMFPPALGLHMVGANMTTTSGLPLNVSASNTSMASLRFEIVHAARVVHCREAATLLSEAQHRHTLSTHSLSP